MGFDFSGGKTSAGFPVRLVFESLDDEEFVRDCWADEPRALTAIASRRRGNFFIQRGLSGQGKLANLRISRTKISGIVSYKRDSGEIVPQLDATLCQRFPDLIVKFQDRFIAKIWVVLKSTRSAENDGRIDGKIIGIVGQLRGRD